MDSRVTEIIRKTKETDIYVKLSLDGDENISAETGVGFLDHMLKSFALHGDFGLEIRCAGDLEVDAHHTAEDVGIALGSAFARILGDRSGITRYGAAAIPMDEALASCHIDICGRPYIVFQADFENEKIGQLDACLIEEFFRAFAFNSGMTLHIACLYGKNDHHKAEAMFKAFAYALKNAVSLSGSRTPLSSKGVL